MRLHHTKNKGDLGILHAQLDLAKKGYGVLSPLTEHEAFDLVAYKEHTFYRVQVKYRAAVDGQICVPFTTCWADRNGIHSVLLDKDFVDVLCIYCPDTDRCHYVDPKQCRRHVRLRISPPRNNQRRGIRWAHEYLDLPATVSGAPACSPTALEQNAGVRQSLLASRRP